MISMKTGIYTTMTNHDYHSTFGGAVYQGDFDARSSMSDIASRIRSDFKFDERCRTNAEHRQQAKQFREV